MEHKILQPEKRWQRSNWMSLAYKLEHFPLTGTMQTTYGTKERQLCPWHCCVCCLICSQGSSSWFIFVRTAGSAPAAPLSRAFQPSGPECAELSKCCAVPCLSVGLHSSSSQLLSSCRAVLAFTTNQLCKGRSTVSPWLAERSWQHESMSSGHSRIVSLLAGCWPPGKKHWCEAKGHSTDQEPREGRRASICARRGYKGSRS